MSKDLVFNQIEQALIHANSEEHAKAILEGFTTEELKALQKYLSAYSTKSKARANLIKAIIECTYTSVRRSQIIRQTRLK